eukprot:scaffold133518_cov15-Tisochrysis_lutea.AAC.2
MGCLDQSIGVLQQLSRILEQTPEQLRMRCCIDLRWTWNAWLLHSTQLGITSHHGHLHAV